MEYSVQLQSLCRMETRRLVLVLGILASIVLIFQYFSLSYRNVILSIIPAVKVPILRQSSLTGDSTPKVVGISDRPLLTNFVNLTGSLIVPGVVEKTEAVVMEDKNMNEIKEKERGPTGNDAALEKDGDLDDFDPDEDRGPDIEFSSHSNIEQVNNVTSRKLRKPANISTLEKATDSGNLSSLANTTKPIGGSAFGSFRESDVTVTLGEVTRGSDKDVTSIPVALSPIGFNMNLNIHENSVTNSSDIVISAAPKMLSTGNKATKTLSREKNTGLLQVGSSVSNDNLTLMFDIAPSKMKSRGSRPRSIPEMNHILRRSHLSRPMKPRWSTARDREILSAKVQIQNAPIVKDDYDLHASLFRNVSRFKRSYELMERMLKVYVYEEGERPIFHSPFLTGIYASEGWFMKQMEGNKHFVVGDPSKAHLFYLPFSARLLELALQKRGLLKMDMRGYLENYVDKIATEYPFWNRTGGADHFLAACHDWAPYETRPRLVSSIRALCNADLYEGFKLGKDVSFPETYVRSAQNPLRDLGGNPVSKRPILAFFAGGMHGWVRPVLLKYWENKDPDMKIFGALPRGTERKITYIWYMKNSKYCICPRGYEVNSPRVVEAIFFECVPVIMSDNFVPPFFEVFDWEAFAVFVAEKDIPNLKNILLSIPNAKYLAMQTRVKKLQRHFLWHKNPVKYDVFHMTLHSVWYNRVNQIRVKCQRL